MAAKGAWGAVAEIFQKGQKTLLEFEARQTAASRMSKNSALRSRADRHKKPFKQASCVSGPRRDGRVVECVGLEIRYTVMLYRGFESLSLLQGAVLWDPKRSKSSSKNPVEPLFYRVFCFVASNGVCWKPTLLGGMTVGTHDQGCWYF